MIITADTKALRAALATAGKIVPAKTPMPILTNIRMATNDNRLTITANNLDMAVDVELPVQVGTEGEACIPFAPLASFCVATKGDTVTIEVGADAVIKSGRNRITLPVQPVADFPTYRIETENEVGIDGPTFCAAMKFCVAAASDSEVQYHLRGVFVDPQDDGLHFWGTDGKRMHHAVMPAAACGSAIVPMDAITMIVSAFGAMSDLRFCVGQSGWQASAAGLRAWGKVIEGVFPDTRRMVSSFEPLTEVMVAPCSELASALAVSQVGNEGLSKSTILRTAADAPLILRGQTAAGTVRHAGRAETETLAMTDAIMAINADHTARALAGMPDGQVSLSVSGSAARPCLSIRPAQASATLSMSALIAGLRASEAELADV